MVRFGAVLRGQGLPLTLGQITDAVRTLEHVDLGDRDEVRRSLRAVLVVCPEEMPVFDRCFDAFWRVPLVVEPGVAGLPAPPAEIEVPGLLADRARAAD